MSKVFLVLTLLFPLSLFAQLNDNFSDGDFTNNPAWSGTSSAFIVNSSKQLQLNSTGASTSYLTSPTALSSLDNLEWHFWIKQSFSPSSSNYGRVYLVSDQSDLTSSLNGYYLQFGEALSNDAVELFKQTGTTSVSVCRGTTAQIANSFTIGIRVTRNASGLWTLAVDGAGGTNYIAEASGTDAAFTSSSSFGVLCTYTSSNATNFYFDDFYIGTVIVDITPPTVSSLNVLSSTQLDVKYSEAVEQTSAESVGNYSVDNGMGNPSAATRDASDLSIVHLTFTTPFGSGATNTITINNVADFSANAIATNTTATFTYYETVPVDSGDVVINEVLFHAEVGGKEFVELYNRSNKYLDLKDIYFYDPTYSVPLFPITSSRRVFSPDEYLAITEDTGDVSTRYLVLDPSKLIQSPNLPSFTDAGDTVRISTSSGALLDQLVYSEDWQFPLLNSATGISIERLNPARVTQDSTNWHSAAENLRATPGYKNSQYSDSQDNGSEVQVEPEVFSPDEDGKDDNVNIHFHFSSPGYTATVQVFDAKGRLVRKLISNELIGNDGAFSWDGLTDKKEKARIGIYVFYVEVFNLKGDTKNYKRTCVLASRL